MDGAPRLAIYPDDAIGQFRFDHQPRRTRNGNQFRPESRAGALRKQTFHSTLCASPTIHPRTRCGRAPAQKTGGTFDRVHREYIVLIRDARSRVFRLLRSFMPMTQTIHEAAHGLVISNSEILGGKSVFRGNLVKQQHKRKATKVTLVISTDLAMPLRGLLTCSIWKPVWRNGRRTRLKISGL